VYCRSRSVTQNSVQAAVCQPGGGRNVSVLSAAVTAGYREATQTHSQLSSHYTLLPGCHGYLNINNSPTPFKYLSIPTPLSLVLKSVTTFARSPCHHLLISIDKSLFYSRTVVLLGFVQH